jgi:hypothetical protein
MATTHPYISGAGNITQMVNQLRKSFPQTVNSETVKKLGLAPNNESSVISVLQFVNLLDKEGKKTPSASEVFSQHKDEDFAKSFEKLVSAAYSSLFDLHGPSTWDLSADDLITFFRHTDQTGAAIGQRQAATFRVLANLSGHGDLQTPKAVKSKVSNGAPRVKPAAKAKPVSAAQTAQGTSGVQLAHPIGGNGFGLTVRVEINLPADGSKETYDNIFKSIRENLLNA